MNKHFILFTVSIFLYASNLLASNHSEDCKEEQNRNTSGEGISLTHPAAKNLSGVNSAITDDTHRFNARDIELVSLPREVMENIVIFMNEDAHKILPQVCKIFKNYVEEWRKESSSFVTIKSSQLTDSNILQIKLYKNIKIFADSVDDVLMKRISQIENLKAFRLGETCISDTALSCLSMLTNLRTLELVPQITRDGYDMEDFPQSRITNAGMAHIGLLTNLEYLTIYKPGITDEGLVYTRSLTNLTKITLWEPNITDAGLLNFQFLTSLKELLIFDNEYNKSTIITDAGLNYLTILTNLKRLSLCGTYVTNQGMDALRLITNPRAKKDDYQC